MDASSSTTSTLSGSMAVNSSFCSYRSPDRFSLSWCGGADAEREAMLMRAAFEGNLLLLKEMARGLDKGRGAAAVVAPLREEGAGALHLAAAEGKMDVCRYLVEELRLDVNVLNDLGETPLFHAVLYGRTDITRYLLDHGANPTIIGHRGSPLHIASVKGDCETVQLLLLRGTNVDIASVPGAPLHLAAAYGKDSTVKILLEHHANPSMVANADNTPLGMAIWAKSLECVKLLIKAGADVNFIFSSGATYVTMAAVYGLTDIMNCLLEAGANPNILDGALGTGTSSDDDDVADLLANRSLCWLHLEDGENALTDANASRVLRPCWPKACYWQGSALMLLKDYGRACQLFAEGLKMDPTDVEIQNALREALDLSKKACHSEQEQ
ncbi:hypothetical protein EJB05_44386 [Eragrostis curvula]|uniref:Uncharacterized protein n=1 Tax=Eragrostis curvula TaxID=38414 RepID=A0A5J9THS8_9POAL|nr:hypothetical protein EJB05_44386 [Eragrostis curvula]